MLGSTDSPLCALITYISKQPCESRYYYYHHHSRAEHGGPEKVTNSSKVTQLVSADAGQFCVLGHQVTMPLHPRFVLRSPWACVSFKWKKKKKEVSFFKWSCLVPPMQKHMRRNTVQMQWCPKGNKERYGIYFFMSVSIFSTFTKGEHLLPKWSKKKNS